MKTDIQIAQESTMKSILDIAKKAGIDQEHIVPFGNDKAKIDLEVLKRADNNGRLILVTAINPTKAGEGKSTTTVGLVDGLARIGKNVMGALREPSLGPVFGIKGGATGGGYAQVIPMESINLHFTGDMHAVTTVNNLISAIIDNHLFQGNNLDIDPEKVIWKRCMDMNDRALREIEIAQGNKNGISRKDGFNITVASEVMAILCLADSLDDFEERIKKIVVAYSRSGKAITVEDLGISGAIKVLMKEAIMPNLVQTLENNPILIHGGPFANIAHGCNSVIATKMALGLADYVVTEAGFGADLGAEKFVDIKCRGAKLNLDAVVVVATVRALKMHGGCEYDKLKEENLELLEKGMDNLRKHIETISQFNVPFVVALNKFASDTEEEISYLKQWCKKEGHPYSLCEGWEKGGEGMIDLANTIITLTEKKSQLLYLYDTNKPLEEKVLTIVQKAYGGKEVEYTDFAKEQLKEFKTRGWDILPVCMAKTPLSLSDDPKKIGRPKDFTLTVRELRISAGAGFVVVLTGEVMTMPGLPKRPAANNMGVDEEGNTYGIF
jgi:Formyltetrahydrofolate synthetase